MNQTANQMLSLLLGIPRSTVGTVMSALYVVLAVVIVTIDRKELGGGFINLNGMPSYLVTLPVSLVGEWLGMKPDFRRLPDMALAIGTCALLMYFIGFGLEKLACLAVSSQPPG